MNLRSVSNKDWKLKQINKNKILHIKESFFLSETLARLLVIKKVDPDNVKLFLKPQLNKNLIFPNLLAGMKNAINHTYNEIINKKKIGIFGDYDVDGAASTAILKRFFDEINHPSIFYIPDRVSEGYGPSIKTFNKLIEKKVSTIITVDCGSLSYKEIDYANLKKINTIVIDHHQVEIILPKALSIINPNRVDDKSNLNQLCAAALTFLFLLALDRKLKDTNWYITNNIQPPILDDSLDLVALASVCDVVPLTGINRYFVKEGLNKFKSKKNLGLKSISEICKINTDPKTYDLGFIYGPRINAAGRLGYSNYGAKLLSTIKQDEAKKLSYQLNKLNEQRKIIENNFLEDIYKIAEKKNKDSVLVIYKDNLHEGIIGILASRLKDRYNKPVIILTGNSNILKASARSILGFNIGLEILNLIKKNIIIKGGGHNAAAGFSIKKDKLDELNLHINSTFIKKMKNKYIKDLIHIDAIISPNALNLNFYNEINYLSPFGNGNKEPIFLIENLKVIKFQIIKEKHISAILLSRNGKSIKSISFNSVNTQVGSYLVSNKKYNLNVVGKLILNKWNGINRIEFNINDIALN